MRTSIRRLVASAAALTAAAAALAGAPAATATTTLTSTTTAVTAYPTIGAVTTAVNVAYVRNGYYYRPGTARVRLEGITRAHLVKPLADGRIAVVSALGLTIHTRGGALAKRVPYVSWIATNDAGTRIATTTPGGTLAVVSHWGTVIRKRTGITNAYPRGFRGGDVWLAWQNDTYRWESTDNRLYRWSPYAATAVNESTGRMTLITSVTDDYRTCYRMVDARYSTPRTLYARCGTFYPMQFSAAPGRHLIGAHALDGLAPGGWQVARPGDGAILLRIGGSGAVDDLQIKDNGTGVAVNVASGGRNAIVQCSWSGSCATATTPVASSDLAPWKYELVSH